LAKNVEKVNAHIEDFVSRDKILYAFVPHFVQNLAPSLSSDPQLLQLLDEPGDLGLSEGSGAGSVPGALNASLAETTDGGLPGVCAGITGTLPGIPAIEPGPRPGIKPGD
jgi:hypothetical protein